MMKTRILKFYVLKYGFHIKVLLKAKLPESHSPVYMNE